jgi:REP element-mobilizing transposase RayT
MANSYISIYVHYVFRTKNRLPLIRPDTQERLWSYMGGIARNNHMKAFAVGGMEDHAHVLVSLPSTLTVSKAIQIIKGNSSNPGNQTHTATVRACHLCFAITNKLWLCVNFERSIMAAITNTNLSAGCSASELRLVPVPSLGPGKKHDFKSAR